LASKKSQKTADAPAPDAPVEVATAPALPIEVTSIKGFDQNLSCRGYQFEFGKTYSVEGPIEACSNGFHACPVDQHPLSVFEFYPPAGARYAEVVQAGASDKQDTKLASASISIKVELSLGDLAQRAVKWVFDRADWKNAATVTADGEGATASGDSGAATASGVRGAATASGYSGAATASGDSGAATASGDSGAATASGDSGAATASGYSGAATASGVRGAATASGVRGAATASGVRGAATASGYSGAATASGREGRARGSDGCALFLVHRDYDWNITAAWAGIVGRDGIKANTWYQLGADGKPFECEAEDAS
jgi:hypothetical protein